MYKVPPSLDELERLVIHLATCYAKGEPCVDFSGNIVEDEYYDRLYSSLQDRRPDSVVFSRSRITPADIAIEEGELITHDPPMHGLTKADGEFEEKKDILTNWIWKCMARLGYDQRAVDAPLFVKSHKLDGVAVAIRWRNGKITAAALRPNRGVQGTSVLQNILGVSGVPERLPEPFTLELRGEIVCTHDDFAIVNKEREDKGEELRANARNHANGAISHQSGVERTQAGRLTFYCYGIVNFADADRYYKTEIERADFVKKTLGLNYIDVSPIDLDNLQIGLAELQVMDDQHPNYFVEVDGAVLAVNCLSDRLLLGHHGDDPTKPPHGMLAWKFKEERKQATLADFTWQAGRTGRITPVGWFLEPVPLAGTMVRKASCANVGLARRMQVGPGSVVLVGKAGKIIPRIYEVISGHTDVTPPSHCPACGSSLSLVPGAGDNEDLICPNEDCVAKHVIGLKFFLDAIGAKGLGPASLSEIASTGKVKDLADLFLLDLPDLLKVDFTEREALLALATIFKVRPKKNNADLLRDIQKARKSKLRLPFWQFFSSLGVPMAGKSVGNLLEQHFQGDMQAVRAASIEDLQQVHGIGEIVASNIHDYLSGKSSMLDRLLDHIEIEQPKIGTLSGMKFVLSGELPPGRSHWQKIIIDNGGQVSSSVSRKTSYLILGPGGGSKQDDARKYGVPIISLDEFQALI